MTVSVKRNKVQYTGDNSTTAFSVTFPYTETSQVKVYLGSTLQTITTHYTLTTPGATGTVTFGTAPGSGVIVSIIRETDYLQAVDYVNNDALDAETLEKAFDKLTMMCQQLDNKIEGAVGFDETVSDSDTTSLKLAAGTTDLAGKLLAFDSTGAFVTTQEIGTFRGTDTTSTTADYVVRDLIRDSSNDNVYFTKQNAPSGTLLTNTSYFELLVDVATVRTLKVAAETARTGAETAETNAAASLASFQGQYKTGSSDPYSGSADAGDLWYDTSASILKYYTGSAFEPVTTSLATVTDNYLTISNQVITAGTVPVSLGGTGATTASGARTALGLGTAATSATGDFEASGAVSTHAAVTSSVHGISAFGATLVDDADAATARTTLGLGTAATSATGDFEASGAVSTHAAVTSSVHGISAFGATLVDDADAATARTTLGLGTAATTAASAYATAAQGTTADSALQDVVDDTTPQLGGDLDVNGNSIVSASNGNIAITPNGTGNVSLGNFTFDADQTVGVGQDNYVLTYDHSTTSISLEAAAGGGISDGDKGDITVSGSGTTWTIDSAAVTYAKIQNVSATDKLLGRSTAGAGSIEEISCTSAGRALLDDANAAAQRTTLGLGTAALSASGDFETAGAVSTHAALTSSVHGISSFGATLVDDADASAARTTLGLGTISTQASDSVSITGGSVTGITDLAIADGGTGASTASVARGNLGLEIGVDVQQYDADTTKNDVANTFTANQIISVTDNTNAALRVTQLGTGNALVVEDSANPDSTPFVVSFDGKVFIGSNTSITSFFGSAPSKLAVSGVASPLVIESVEDNVSGSRIDLLKTRGTTSNSKTIINNNDTYGEIYFGGTDGTSAIPAARIFAQVDGTPGTNDMPGRLSFSTTADGASSPTERMRIESSGSVGINRFGSTQNVNSGDHGFFYNNGSGYLVLGNGGDTACILNRWTNQGHLIQFRYNGSTVGSISTNGSALPSDRDFKKDINDLNLGLELIKKLKPKTYRYHFDEAHSPFMTGFVAQDLEESLSEVGVAQNKSWILQYNENVESGNSKYELDYSKLIPILTKAIQEQQTLIESQQSQIDALTARIEALETT